MQKLFYSFLFAFLCLAQPVFAQSASVSGVVLENNEGQPISFASVTLYSAPENKVLGGALTDAQGKFLIDKLREGSYQVQVQFMGYESQKIGNLALSRNQQLNLGSIRLMPSQKLLQEIQVTGQKASVYHQVDKQVYSAGQFQSALGGTATDVIKNMPSVSVDAGGQISMRGSTGFTVLLNGKPIQADAAQVLSQIPANAIENVEIITSPSARYDADGKGGIINITTKKGADNGLQLLANVQAGLPSIETYDNKEPARRYGSDITLSYKKDQWDFSAGGSYVRNDNTGRRVGDVNTTIGNRYTSFPSVGERSFDKYNHSVRAAVGFTPDARNAFRAGFYHGTRTEYRLADIFYNNTNINTETGEVVGRSQYFNSNLVKKKGAFTIGNLDYTHTFANKSSLSLSGLLEADKLSGYTKNRNLRDAESADTLQYTLNTNERPLTGYRLKADYALPLGPGKLESGYQYRFHQDDGNFVYLQKEGNGDTFDYYPEFSGKVDLSNLIHAVYSQYSGQQQKWSYTGGLRYEYATRRLVIGDNGEPYKLNLSNLFPSANVMYAHNEDWKFKTGYSRRVQRSSSFELNPLPEREHSETLEQGDPRLLPEFINLGEVGLIKGFSKGSLFANLYFQDIKNAINRVNNVYADTILGRIYTNAGRARRLGLEAGADLNLASWWKVYLGGNVYDYKIKGSLFNNTVAVNNGSLVYSLNVNTSFTLPRGFMLQWNLNYLSDRATAQGEDSRFYSPNASLKKTFMGGKLAATLQWQHMDLGLLRSNEQRISTWGNDFYTTTNYIYEVDVVQLHLGFNLNQLTRKVKFTESEFGEKEF